MRGTAIPICFLLLLVAPAAAQLTAGELAEFGQTLDTRITITNTELVESPQAVLVLFEVYNPLDEVMPVYIVRQESESEWQIVKLLGGLAPEQYTRLELEVQVQYERETSKMTRYAIVGKDSGGNLYGRYFEINEDWASYEKNVGDSLTSALVVFVPLMGALLVIAAIVIAQSAYPDRPQARLSQDAGTGEYTLESLVFPDTKGKSMGEKIANVMVHPAAIAVELACVALMVSLMADSISQALGDENAMKIMALTAVGAFAVPFLYLLLSWYLLRREEGKPLRFFAGMFTWGMFVAFASFVISSVLVGEVKGVAAGAYLTIAVILLTPAVEETLKGLGVFLMSGHHEYNDTLTGMMLGFTCGAGFAFVENWFYFSLKANPFDLGMGPWLVFILYRSFFNTLAHGCFTAALSTLPGYLRGVPGLGKYAQLAFLPGLVLAIAIHAIFNMSAVLDQFLIPSRQAVFFTFNPLIIILLGAIFFLVLVLAVIDEKKRKIQKSAPLSFRPPPQKAEGRKEAN